MARITCVQCHRPRNFCFCEQLKPQNSQHPVWLMQYSAETSHPIGTAKIAHLGLNNSRLFIADNVSENQDLAQEIIAQQPLLIFPSDNSIPLSEYLKQSDSEPDKPLLFLDATWRKAKRMYLESPELTKLTHVHIDEVIEPRYKIRKAPPLNNSALSTLEAVVYTLRALEKNKHGYQNLLDVMDWVIQQQLSKIDKAIIESRYTSID